MTLCWQNGNVAIAFAIQTYVYESTDTLDHRVNIHDNIVQEITHLRSRHSDEYIFKISASILPLDHETLYDTRQTRD